MIVAPLMTPILGTALAVVLADRDHVVRSVLLVVGGAMAVIAIAYLMGLFGSPLDAYAGNGQVDARIHPTLIDLTAALATGTVGAFALVRSDISDTLPGVAIAISLVPPLAVVGLLLSVQRYSDAAGALLLFGTNVAAIIATGAVVLLFYRVRPIAIAGGFPVGNLRGLSLVVVAAMVVIVAVPLALGSLAVARDQQLAASARPLAESWAAQNDWALTAVSAKDSTVVVTALGAPPDADPEQLRDLMDENGLDWADLQVALVVGGAVTCPSDGDACTGTGR
jgi:uncharacterized hydrophobic protein (TIGR00271 family)